MTNYNVIKTKGKPIKAWTKGVAFEEEAQAQLEKLATLPFIYKHLAVMPDVHGGKGSCVGTVIATQHAIIPAAVGVDIGCGMMACQTALTASDLPDNLYDLRTAIEAAIPHGSKPGTKIGQWTNESLPPLIAAAWYGQLNVGFQAICENHQRIKNSNNILHLGTLGGGNHFIEVCLDEDLRVWLMLHSGSRGVGNLIGNHFIELAQKEMERFFINLPSRDMAYLPNGTQYYDDYIHAVFWAQKFAEINRRMMMIRLVDTISNYLGRSIGAAPIAIECHHNYISKERHFGENAWITRKGAVKASAESYGIIPGSMGAKSFIVKGLGNPESFDSCSHGAGRVMSRTKAKELISLDDHQYMLHDVECRKDATTLDESPHAYKDIDAVMRAQNDLVQILHTLKQVLCIKG